jgi:hypothetical protein
MAESERVIRGSRLCGGVRFEITGKPLWMSHCHCSRCRKVGGITNVAVRAEHVRLLEGRKLIHRYEPEPPYHPVRCFCRSCGSYLGEIETNPKGFPVAASALDDDPGVRPVPHEHVAEKAPWYEILDDLPQFPGHPPGFGEKSRE